MGCCAMGRTAVIRRRRGATVERFSVAQRVEHFLLLLCFNVLALTGLPQKYASSGWGERLISALGGIDQTRLIHRTAAAIVMAQGFYHLVAVLVSRRRAVRRHDMRVSFQDVLGMLGDIRYLTGRSRERPQFGRFDYRQKFEYWAVVWGTVIMAVTGLIMWFPTVITQWLPGVVIPAARVAHGGEALLALFAVIIWHFYNAHFRPDIFPMDPAMFTGTISLERLEHEHRHEYEDLRERGLLPPPD